ncbi:MAG: 2-oxoacid:acceptor oxidoreductase subunit alpha [Gammaproteobacteria bacterium]|jgi:2-oxoglutarate/2-oxoacid ferredoxin oxidoreductase subunit alpha|nr:2-oxoacid:acceptor oxidoreductase subunit alpha [Gammaproteobacteria bacterium]
MTQKSSRGSGRAKKAKATAGGILEIENVIIRFAGDSGDGIQITGALFSHDSAVVGNDISTLPDFPAEIRAPAGTLAGVSSFQLNFSSYDVHTPGDRPDVLVALNPAALKVHLKDLKRSGTLIVNHDAFDANGLKKAGYEQDPRKDGSLAGYQVYDFPITTLTVAAVESSWLSKKQAELSKNMFTLGIISWLYDRSLDALVQRIEQLFATKKPELAEANKLALQAGFNFADTVEVFTSRYRVSKADLPVGDYKRITGNEATALGFLAASELSGRPLFYASYPITPASDILHELSRLRHFGVKTFQAEDEIAAIGIALGAAWGGSLGLTGTSGPGVALKSEFIGLAVMTELPIVIASIQRGGPSTGLPTKTEQADLLQAMYGRNGECPVPIVAPSTPGECFEMAIEAFRIAIKYMTPVFFLSDGYLANGSEPWRIPEPEEITPFEIDSSDIPENYAPYRRDPETLARRWVVPGTPGHEHRIGGLETEDITGNVSYDSENHERMVKLRQEKIDGIANDIPDIAVHGPQSGDLLVLGWGSTRGACRHAIENAQANGLSVSGAQLRYLNPFPKNLESVLNSFKYVLVPELNLGQLRMMLRAEFLIDVIGLNKVQGQPLLTSDVEEKIYEILNFDYPQSAQA